MSDVLHVPEDHALNRLDESLKRRLVRAQTNLVDMAFASSQHLFAQAADDLKMSLELPAALAEQPVDVLGNKPSIQLRDVVEDVLKQNRIPPEAITSQAASLAHRIQLLRAFDEPEHVVRDVCHKVCDIVGRFPTSADDIRCGRNPGDVLDPYILAAAQQLMYAGDFAHTIDASVAHKVLMMIEGLLGHLHEDVLGAMRGNLRAPEPRGKDQETLHPKANPFPGADIVQPPIGDRRPLRFHQLKSKTGSAKGGDGRRLGLQLLKLHEVYGGEIYYDAVIGNTLRGHRSMAGVKRAAPDVVVLVGGATFNILSDSLVGPELLLRLYQSAFDVAIRETGYSFAEIAARIYEAFSARADELGEGFLESILADAISGPRQEQDSRYFTPRTRGRRVRRTR